LGRWLQTHCPIFFIPKYVIEKTCFYITFGEYLPYELLRKHLNE